jgi:hypothetical protein
MSYVRSTPAAIQRIGEYPELTSCLIDDCTAFIAEETFWQRVRDLYNCEIKVKDRR